MTRRHLAALAIAAAGLGACRSRDPAKELAVAGLHTYWVVDSPQQGENYIAPAVRFQLRNIGTEPLGSVDARARFPAPDQDEVWGSIQEQVSSWKRPLQPGQEVTVTVRSSGRYHSPAAPEDILRSPSFRDPRVEVYLRIGASSWAMLAQGEVERRIGAPGIIPTAQP